LQCLNQAPRRCPLCQRALISANVASYPYNYFAIGTLAMLRTQQADAQRPVQTVPSAAAAAAAAAAQPRVDARARLANAQQASSPPRAAPEQVSQARPPRPPPPRQHNAAEQGQRLAQPPPRGPAERPAPPMPLACQRSMPYGPQWLNLTYGCDAYIVSSEILTLLPGSELIKTELGSIRSGLLTDCSS
jgi:hypothetical protein